MEVTIDYNGQMVSVEVTEEVFAFLNYADHKEENLAHEQRRHWDGREFDEYIVQKEGCIRFVQSPEQEAMPQGNHAGNPESVGALYREAA